MIIVIDGDYNENIGNMAGVLIKNFEDEEICGFISSIVKDIGEYESGSFYKRELKGIENLIKQLNISTIDYIVIDGYARFGIESHKALGERVFDKYNIPIIGIAKKRNNLCILDNTEVIRGDSRNPLFVTSVGCSQDFANKKVLNMYGKNRLPYIVKLVDSLARKNQITLYKH